MSTYLSTSPRTFLTERLPIDEVISIYSEINKEIVHTSLERGDVLPYSMAVRTLKNRTLMNQPMLLKCAWNRL